MRPKASIQLLIAVLGIGPLMVFAGEPATRPSPVAAQAPLDGVAPQTNPVDGTNTHPGDHATGDRQPVGENAPGGRARPGQRFQPPLQSEIEDAMQFMQTNSPNRFKALDSLPDGEKKNRLKNVATRAYLQLMRSSPKETQPELFKVAVDRTKMEDAVFGLVTELHKTPPDQQEALKTQLRAKVAELVSIGLKERQMRLTILQDTVKEEQQKLTQDQARETALVDQRYSEVLANGEKGLGGLGIGGGANGGAAQHNRGGPHQPPDGQPGSP